MTTLSKADIVRRCFDAYRTRQRAVIEELLADDLHFTSPYDDAIDRATYFARCWPNSELFRSIDIETICENSEHHAFVRYKIVALDGREFRNMEFFTIANGRVHAIEVYFGATYKDGVFVGQQPAA